ncbi:MAG: carboxy terminal-processing peptidase [Saprospiraceae bacterium]|nr:carboxy terminal-processing peptidase [Saprospiraceae bacterium]
MKIRGPLFFSVLALTLVLAAFYPQPVDNSQKEAILMRSVLTYLNQLHYNPKSIDDDFSSQLYDYYVDGVDATRRYMTQEDLKQLEPFKQQLDDQVNTGNYDFFNLSLELLSSGIEKAKQFYPEILATPFDFTVNENFELDGEKRGYAKNDTELKEYWRQMLKYEAMTRLSRKLTSKEEKQEKGETTRSFEELEKEARQDVQETYDDLFNRIAKIKRMERLSYYLNCITMLFDPHTNYYKPLDKENFDIGMSGKLEGIGARLVQDGDYVQIDEVVVGGPAWQGKELEDKDQILKVAQGEEGEWVDIVGWTTADAVTKIRGKKGTTVRLMVRKVDGTTKEISIVRDVINIEEYFARSLILNGNEPDSKIGYIYLPKFYADFDDPNGRFAAKDVAAELEKLKTEGVDGIILDVRNNGGGSLMEVVRMTGLFIERGPVVQAKYRTRDPEIYRDTDAKVVYDGPLAIMTNGFRASASEILAGAIQDYNRRIVVGSKATFGKGTVQRFFPLDRAVRGMDDIKPLGEIKLTFQKFFRITGESNQLRGVIPDIILPDRYHYIETGEREEDFPLAWTKIETVPFSQNVYNIGDTESLTKRSENRIKGNETFNNILDNARRLAQQRDDSEINLNLENYRTQQQEQRETNKAFNAQFDKVVIDGVANPNVDLDKINASEKAKDRNNDFLESVSKDVYIKETIQILHDMVKAS